MFESQRDFIHPKNNIYNSVDSDRAGGLHALHAFDPCKRLGTFIRATFLPSPTSVLAVPSMRLQASDCTVAAGSLRITSSRHRLQLKGGLFLSMECK